MKLPILLFSMLLACTIHSTAQKLRFTDTSNVWQIMRYAGEPPMSYPYTAFYTNDTVLGGITYHTLHDNYQSAFVREDTITDLVYARLAWGSDTTEGVLFNYNLQAGDTIRIGIGSSSYRDSVMAVDSILINGLYHKVFSMSRGYTRYTVTEGVGCMTSPLFPIDGTCFEAAIFLLCYGNSTGYPSFSANFQACYNVHPTFTNSVDCTNAADQAAAPALSLSPNPATDHIMLSGLRPGGALCIWDMTGHCIYRQVITSTAPVSINTTQWPRGIYQLMYDGTTPARQRFVLE